MTLFLNTFPNLSNARVLVVGDVMLDRFCYGAVTRISPEAPVPVINLQREIEMLGGAGNVLANLTALSTHSSMIGVVGSDNAGLQCRRLLSKLTSNPNYIVEDETRQTTVKTRFISGSQQLLRCDKESASELKKKTKNSLIKAFDACHKDFDAIILSDYAKGVLDNGTTRHFIDRARVSNIPVIVDPKRRDLGVYRGCSIIKPNRHELEAYASRRLPSISDIEKVAARLHQETGAAVLVTLSGEGMVLFVNPTEIHHFPATATEVFDVSGAGDTAISILAACVAAKLDIASSSQLANIGAGLVVRKLGTASVTLQEIEKAFNETNYELFPSKSMAIDEAVAAAAGWKNRGLRVGFTNGCFDILHAGHVHSLEGCKSKCDKLIIGLNSDASIKRLKGPSRPIHEAGSRSRVLSALSCVDAVVVFEEDTPSTLIEKILPTDLFKGADYSEDEIAGADFVKSINGRVHRLPILNGHSTTEAIRKLQEQSTVKTD